MFLFKSTIPGHYLFSRLKLAKSWIFVMNSDTGDRMWGHLESTELFGRVSNSADYIQLSADALKDPQYCECVQACHCMIFARSTKRIFNLYSARAAVLVSDYKNIINTIKFNTIMETSWYVKVWNTDQEKFCFLQIK